MICLGYVTSLTPRVGSFVLWKALFAAWSGWVPHQYSVPSSPCAELHSLVEGFDWQTLESTLLHALRGGKGRDLKEMGRFQRGHVCTILNEGVYTI